MTSPRPEDWPRIRALFERALEISIEQRDAFLAHACDGDEAARQHVRALLESNDQAGNFLEGSPPAALMELVPDAEGGQPADGLASDLVRHVIAIKGILPPSAQGVPDIEELLNFSYVRFRQVGLFGDEADTGIWRELLPSISCP